MNAPAEMDRYPAPSGAPFYAHVKEGYDQLAASYDDEIGRNAVGTRMRHVFREVVARHLPSRGRLLELGCGTGLESLWLARRGFDVVATDVSSEMLAQLERKASRDGLQERIQCRPLAAGDIAALTSECGDHAFDGAICHAGALNMEPRLESVPEQLALLMRKGSPFVCSVINETSLFEIVFYLLALRPRKAFRRLGNVVPMPISRQPPLRSYVVPTRFYAPRKVLRLFARYFDPEEIRGLQIFLPPSNLTREFERARPVFGLAERIEDLAAGQWPFREWGHHTIFAFSRR